MALRATRAFIRSRMRSHSAHRGSGGRRDAIHPVTADGMARLFGRTPDVGYVFQESASPCVESFGSGEDLVQAGDPTFAVDAKYHGKRALEFVTDDNGNAKPVSATFADYTTGSFAFLAHVQFTSHRVAGNGGLLGKNPSSNPRYLSQVNTSGYVAWQIHDGSSLYNTNVAVDTDGADTWLWLGCDRTADILWISHQLGTSTLSIAGASGNTLTNAQPLRLGSLTGQATGVKYLALYLFSGSDAEGDPRPNLRRVERRIR